MIRILAIAAAIALIGYSLWVIYGMTVPVAEVRAGNYHDFIAFAIALLLIYGSVLFGVTVYWARVGRTWRRLHPVKAFAVGVLGALAGYVVYHVVCGVSGLITQGSFRQGIEFWPIVFMLVMIVSVVVSGGMALLLYGLRPSGDGD